MKISRPGILAVLLLVVGLPLAGLQLHKSVTLVVDGASQKVDTFALTTGQLLGELQVPVGPEDRVAPNLDTWLPDDSTVYLERAAPVTILEEGTSIHLLTTERIPARWLEEAGVPFEEGDEITRAGVPIDPRQPLPSAAAAVVSIHRPVRVVLQDGAHTYSFESLEATVGEALWEAGYLLYAADRLEPPPETPLTGEEMLVQLDRSREVVIQVGEDTVTVRTSAQTVGEALADGGLAGQWLDYTIPPEDAPLPASGQVRLVRVKEDVLIDQTPLPFESEYQAAPDLELDSQQVLSPGEYGLLARRVRVRYEDGVEVARQVEDEWVAKQPQNQVIGYGTNVVMHSLDTPDGTIYYWRALTFWITSYSDKIGTITASGQRVRKGLVAVNPHYIPYGTMMYVPGYGYAEAADTGNLGPRWIDLGYTADEYVAWHKYTTVYFLWPPPENILWLYPK